MKEEKKRKKSLRYSQKKNVFKKENCILDKTEKVGGGREIDCIQIISVLVAGQTNCIYRLNLYPWKV